MLMKPIFYFTSTSYISHTSFTPQVGSSKISMAIHSNRFLVASIYSGSNYNIHLSLLHKPKIQSDLLLPNFESY